MFLDTRMLTLLCTCTHLRKHVLYIFPIINPKYGLSRAFFSPNLGTQRILLRAYGSVKATGRHRGQARRQEPSAYRVHRHNGIRTLTHGGVYICVRYAESLNPSTLEDRRSE